MRNGWIGSGVLDECGLERWNGNGFKEGGFEIYGSTEYNITS